MRKQLLLSILVIISLCFTGWAKPIDSQQAFRAALAWLHICPDYQSGGTLAYAPEKEMLKILNRKGDITVAYVLTLKPAGFIVVSPDNELKPIIGSSAKSYFDSREDPENHGLIFIRSSIAAKQKALREGSIDPDYRREAITRWNEYLKMVNPQGVFVPEGGKGIMYAVEHGPFLSSLWSQGNYYDENGDKQAVYNYYTPPGPDGSTGNYVCGCVATAQAQILNFFEWPVTGTGSHSYTWNSQTLSADFGATTYDWSNMLDVYANGTATTLTERQAVGKLTYHCGVSVDMSYSSGGSGASTSSVAPSMHNYFRCSGEYVDSSATFWTRLDDNMIHHRPGELSIRSTTNAGHAIVIDGIRYDDPSNKEYHLNFGWAGNSNGWYDISNNFSAGGYTWSTISGAVLDIVPTPDLNDPGTSATSTDFTVSWNVADSLNATKYELQQAVITDALSSFNDDAESGTGNWETDGYWEQSGYYSHSSSYSFHGDIYNGSAWKYPGTFTVGKALKIDASTTIDYWYRLRYFDNYEARLEIAEEGPSGWYWTTLKTYTASGDVGWTSETITTTDLSAYVGKIVSLRFAIDYLGGSISYGSAGFYFDDFVINNGNIADWTVVDNNILTESKSISAVTNGDHLYRVRANWNSQWWNWSNIEDITVDVFPTVTTSAVSSVTKNSASGGGNVTAEGSTPVTEKGIVWDTTPDPTISSYLGKTVAGSGGTGSYTCSMSGLSEGTVYYVRAYATNSHATSYGANERFLTKMTYPGNALDFDGVDDAITTTLDVQPSAMPTTTWEAWIYPRDITSRQQILCSDDGGYDRFLAIDGGNYYIGCGSAWYPAAAVLNEWQHVAVVFKTDNVLFYLNGVEYSRGSAPSGGSTVNNLKIGEYANSSQWNFNGQLDEVRIWSDVRTQGEINDNMFNCLNGTEDNLVCYYNFDCGGGTLLIDMTANEYDGTLQNMTDSDWVASTAPVGESGTTVNTTTPTSIGNSGQQAQVTITSVPSSSNCLGIYCSGDGSGSVTSENFGSSGATQRADILWGIEEFGDVTADLLFDYSSVAGINDPSAIKLLKRSDCNSAWTDVTAQFTHDQGNRTFSKSGVTSFSEFSVGDGGDNPLPVELSSFTASLQNNHVILKWTTQSETNNAGFEITRSMNDDENYQMITNYLQNPQLKGQGNSTSPADYSFIDQRVTPGNTYWYKLIDVDLNGNRSSHDPISILFPNGIHSISENIPDNFRLYQNYPNPFNPNTTLRFDIPRLDNEIGKASLIIYNSLGEMVRVLHRGKIEPGRYEVFWDGRDWSGNRLPSGIYYIMLTADYFSQTVKTVLIK